MSATAQHADSHRSHAPRSASVDPERRRAGGSRNGPCPDLSYSLSSFLEDQHRLLSEADPRFSDVSLAIERIDGRFLIVRTEILKEVDDVKRADLFRRKYGQHTGKYCHARFTSLLEFLADRRTALVTAGLAEMNEPMAVREEFVRYLLTSDVGGHRANIPESVIQRFLDEWSHRWM
jgi:hypothetical protein